ncbi:MAG TPA: hypothetical protein VK206_04700, partial [Anaerolineales bacterium]|nr:hypothetical protein [Anaerolineales bacterium]
MDNQPSFNRDLIIPILIGGFSVVGIIVVLLFARVLNSPAAVAMTPSATPFQYLYLGTEPAITTPLLEGSEIPQPTGGLFNPTSSSVATPLFLVTATSTRSSGATPLVLNTATATGSVLRTNTPVRSPTSTSGTATVPNTYDDTDSRLMYSGTWSSQTNVNGAHQGTLHVSTTIGDSINFTFTGDEIHLFYQSGPSL